MLWILGEYCEQPSEITNFMRAVEKSVGDLPIVEKELKMAAGDVEEEEGEKKDDQPEKNNVGIYDRKQNIFDFENF